MNPCIPILFLISNILLVTIGSEVGQQKRMQTKPSSSSKKPKYSSSSTRKDISIGEKVYIAVIGGGINTALFTHYLHGLLDAEVHIYNHDTPQKIDNSLFIVHEKQKYMMEIVSKFNLETKDLNQGVVMYDGQKNQELNFYKSDPIKPFIEFHIKHLMRKFDKIYDIQQKELRSFTSLSNLLLSMSETFPKLLSITTRKFILDKQKRRKKIANIKETINSLLLLNYGQNLESNAFAGLTSLIFSQSTGKLKQITTPIDQIVRKLINESDQLFNLNVLKMTYEKVSRLYRPQVSGINEDGKKLSQIYDYVILATPEIGDIFSELRNLIAVCQNRKMILTKITASLKEEVFKNSNLVTGIANVKDLGSIRLANKISNSEWEVITDDDDGVLNEISSIFNVTGTAIVNRMALWPDYSDKECPLKATFDLDTRLFYLNAIEWASSSLEMKAIGAKNVALRIKNLEDTLIRRDRLHRWLHNSGIN